MCIVGLILLTKFGADHDADPQKTCRNKLNFLANFQPIRNYSKIEINFCSFVRLHFRLMMGFSFDRKKKRNLTNPIHTIHADYLLLSLSGLFWHISILNFIMFSFMKMEKCFFFLSYYTLGCIDSIPKNSLIFKRNLHSLISDFNKSKLPIYI